MERLNTNIPELQERFNDITIHSWTWNRLTEEEKYNFRWRVNFHVCKGTKRQRIEIYEQIYHAFLVGLGYTPGNWREPDPTAPTF